MRQHRGFTLIEIMISIAILAILMAAPISMRNGAHFLAVEGDYRSALRNARFQIDTLREAPLASLPPCVMTPDAGGRIQLDTPHLVEGSIHLRTLDGRLLSARHIDPAKGEIEVDTRDAVIVDFAFLAADQGEAHSATSTSFVLDNAPVVAVSAVCIVDGDTLTPLAPSRWTLDQTSGRLTVPAEAVGHVVRVDYLGGRIRNRVSGSFLGDDLRPCAGVGPIKQIRVEESYGGEVGRLRLQFLGVAR